MAKLGISTGTVPNDGTGDSLLDGAVKINSNFDEIYTYFGDGTNLSFSGGKWITTAAGIHTLSNVGVGTTNPRFDLEVGAVGASGTSLWVNGDARVTGILTVGTASITLDGSSNRVTVGSGVTIDGNTGIIDVSSITLGGNTLTGVGVTSITAGEGISVDQSTGNVTITTTGGGESYWSQTAAGIHTLSNVGVGTTNPTSALTVTGNALVTGIATITGVATINGINISAGNNDSNTGVGKESLLSVSGQENTAFGRSALFSTLGGQSNTGIGYQALYTSAGTTPDSSYNTALGWKAMRLNTTGSQNVAVGGQALESNLSGFGNVALGQGANNANTTANYNTSVGWAALAANTTGSYNIAIGFYAGWIGPISGNHNVLIGPVEISNSSSPTAAPPIAGGSNQLVIGAGSTAWIYGNSSYNIGIGTTNPTEKLTVVGVTSSTLFYGDASYTTSGRWILGANGTSDYTFTGIGFTQTTNDPVLYLARGRVYEFVNNSGGAHPFEIRVSNGGAAYSDGVTNNAAATGVIRFEVPFNAPNTLYYQCTNHSGMGNTISVYPNLLA
jgi:hypothetical protein